MFITFEGIDGCGKTTQAAMLAEWFEKKGKEVCLTKEPYEFDVARLAKERKVGKSALMLFVADRAMHLDDVIRPALARDEVVICDRYIDSTHVYQDTYQWEPYVKDLCEFASYYMTPDITFLIDIDPNEAMRRTKERGSQDAFDKESIEAHAKRQSDFLRIAEKDKERVKVVYGGVDEQAIHKKIRGYLK